MAKYRTNPSAKLQKPLRKPANRPAKKSDDMVLREDSTPYQVNGNDENKRETLNVLDTFAGAGGFSLGFELAGCSVVGGIEIDSWASETFAHNHKEALVIKRDIQLISDGELLDFFAGRWPDILLGGPPCQGFSVCRKNAGDPTDPKNSLFVEFIRAARVLQPDYVIMENVPNIEKARTQRGESVIGIVERELKELGYHVNHAILEATDFGIPQIRKRLFIVASVHELKNPFPAATHCIRGGVDDLFGGSLERCPTLWEAISDLPDLAAGEGSDNQDYTQASENDYQRALRKGSKRLWNHTAMRHSKRMVERFAAMACGQSVSDVAKHLHPLKRNGNGEISGKIYDQNNRRMHPDRPCHTIPASFYANFVHPYQHRNFTPREGARLQSFPDAFVFKGKPTVVSHKLLAREGRDEEKHLCQYNQIGNAVPPLLAKAIAENLLSQSKIEKGVQYACSKHTMKQSLTHITQRLAASSWIVLLLFLGGLWSPAVSQAEVTLPHVFGSHMVLQQEKPLIIWGWATPGETVKVQMGSASQTAQANAKGEWKVVLPAMKAGGPYTLTVSGSSTVTLEDVMIGEVWLCSGQSNMEFGIGNGNNAKEEIANANHPGIRLLMVDNNWTPLPQSDMKGTWKVCTPETVAEGGWNGFSAAGYFFGRELNEKLGVAVGLVEADWGGTRIESWTPPEGFAAVPALKNEYEKVQLGDPRTPLHQQRLDQTLNQFEQWDRAARKAMIAQEIVPPVPDYPDELRAPHDLQQATALYNGMIHPLEPFPIRGAIWYQGESNMGEGMRYAEHMKALVTGWRKLWGEGDFPFYFVQIAPHNYGGNPEAEAELWEAQTVAANTIPNAGMAVVNDIGNLQNIHPTDKQDVGHRLALLALAKTYGRTNLVYSGPTCKSLAVDGASLRVTFDHVGGGLASRDGKPLDWFEIIDADEGGFVKADARIDGNSVILSAPGVKHPVAMRFAWSGLAEPNLMNVEGLPAGAFRAGEVPKRDWVGMNVPEAKDYQVVYDLDLTKLGPAIKYDLDNHENIHKPFDRIAYFVELQDANLNTQDVFVSMDAFTTDLGKIGVPVFGSGAVFQQNVTNLDVFSNVKGIVTGTGLDGGNIEFWPNNYGPANSANVPNASSDVFDFGDQRTDPADGYGSMQVHNHDARQTLFAINHWREGGNADVGIGNQAKGNPDWTFAGNAHSYHAMRLRVLVRCR